MEITVTVSSDHTAKNCCSSSVFCLVFQCKCPKILKSKYIDWRSKMIGVDGNTLQVMQITITDSSTFGVKGALQLPKISLLGFFILKISKLSSGDEK